GPGQLPAHLEEEEQRDEPARAHLRTIHDRRWRVNVIGSPERRGGMPMGDMSDHETRLHVAALSASRDLRREAGRLERLREGRAAVTDMASRRRWPSPDPDDDPREAA